MSSFTPLHIGTAQSASPRSLITATEGGVLNEQRCNTKHVIDFSIMEYHNGKAPLPISIFEEEEEGEIPQQFGILTIKTKKTSIIRNTLLFIFSLDTSGSMNESSDIRYHRNNYVSNSKMDYLKQSFKNMLHFFAKHNSNDVHIYIRVHTFNDNVDIIIKDTLVTLDNVNELISKIDAIDAMGGTNIGAALTHANDAMSTYYTENPSHEICHILMTDGEPTSGETTTRSLLKLMHPTFASILCGIGKNHKSLLLQQLSATPKSEYQFINNMEHTGLIYGETIHRFLYPAIKNVNIVMRNATIYDWQTNQWTNQLNESVIIGDITKIYHVRSAEPEIAEAEIYGIIAGAGVRENDTEEHDVSDEIFMGVPLLEIAYTLPELILESTNAYLNESICGIDLTKYMFRQKTLELLFEIKNVITSNRSQLKQKMLTFFKTMREYMTDKALTEDSFMKQLCDDIHISYTMMDTTEGSMYAHARQSSQGRQRTYNTSINIDELEVDDDFNDDSFNDFDDTQSAATMVHSYMNNSNTNSTKTASLNHRFRNLIYNEDMSNEEENEIMEMNMYTPSRGQTNAYATPSITATMMEASQSMD